MKRLGINYDHTSNGFEDIKDVQTNLVYGDLSYIKRPWFSYIIPVYKRPDLLRKTLESVLAQKEVDFSWDIVIVDNETQKDNPTERMIREMDEKRILYYRNEKNIGPGGNYNRCIEMARAPWVALLHGDDLIMNDHLRLMAKYINRYRRGFTELAYISPRYVDFSDEKYVKLDRSRLKEDVVCYFGRCKRLTFLDVMITGNTVGVPSMGTVMNRRIMLKTGGFHVDLGVCEDVITPYKLSKNYRVYTTPRLMGYYRFERNTCLKRQVLFDICEGMTDFREYLFQKNLFTRLWAKVVREEFFKNMTVYCTHVSRYGDDKVKISEFDYIFPEKEKKPAWINELYFKINTLYSIMNGYISFEEKIRIDLRIVLRHIHERGYKNVVVYGAGRAGTNVARLLKKEKSVEMICFAVTSLEGNEPIINGIPVKDIHELVDLREEVFVIISATIEEYCEEMTDKLNSLGFKHKCILSKDIRKSMRMEGHNHGHFSVSAK